MMWDTPLVNFQNGFPDFYVPLCPCAMPWEPGVVICLLRVKAWIHGPVPIDPRQALIRQVERAAEMGIQIQVGTELEFYLLDPETGQPRRPAMTATALPVPQRWNLFWAQSDSRLTPLAFLSNNPIPNMRLVG